MINDYLEEILQGNLLKNAKGASNEEISMLEKKMGLTFADDYRQFLLKIGACIFNGHEIAGISGFPDLNVETVTSKARLQAPAIPSDLYAIENAHIDGIIIWQDEKGVIYQTAPHREPVQICNSLEDYINR